MPRWVAKLDKRCRVTIPKPLRDQYQIKPGDDFDFLVDDRGVFMIRRADNLTLKLTATTDTHP